MNKNSSYKYIFWEILKFIEEIKIEYHHKLKITVEKESVDLSEMEMSSKWELGLISFCKFPSKKNFRESLVKQIDSRINYISKNKVELCDFYDYFIDRINESTAKFEKLESNETAFSDLVDEGVIILNYKGFERQLWGLESNKSRKVDSDELDLNKIYDFSKKYFDVIIQEFNRLIMFLQHELNLIKLQKEQLQTQKGKDKFIELIKKGEIQKLFDKLNLSESYKYNKDLIQLSARYFMLEKDKDKNIINRDEYNNQLAKLINSILNVILKH